MRKDWRVWTVHINSYHIDNWAVGLDYYKIFDKAPIALIARVLQINLLFFNITLTRWQAPRWI